MKKSLKILFPVVLILLIPLVIISGCSNIPGLSCLCGMIKPKDLGVRWTAADYQSLKNKIGGTPHQTLPDTVPPEGSIKYTGQHPVKADLTQEEITAALNNYDYKYNPIKDVQVKFNTDNSVEFSGTLIKDRLANTARAIKFTRVDIKTIEDSIKVLPINPPVYIKGRLEIIENKVRMIEIHKADMGGISLTPEQVNQNLNTIIGTLEDVMRSVNGLTVKSARIEGGRFRFDGTFPQQRSMVPDPDFKR